MCELRQRATFLMSTMLETTTTNESSNRLAIVFFINLSEQKASQTPAKENTKNEVLSKKKLELIVLITRQVAAV